MLISPRRALLLAAGLGAILSMSAPAAPASAKSVAPGEGEAPAPALEWTSCGGSFQCATLTVPIDYARPTGPTLDLALVRLPASNPAQRTGSLLVNPGGPGASAVDFVFGLAPALAAEIRARFDIVGFDPRGVGESTPIVCHENLQQYFAADPSPDTQAEWDQMKAVAKAFSDGCAAKYAGLLPYLGTRNTARDMEQVRIALGEQKLSYLGYSYGTVIGAVYADMYPDRVRAFVLDGAFNFYSIDGPEALRRQSVAFEGALNAFLADCSARRCPLAAGGDPRTALDTLLAQVDAAPLPAPGADRPAGPGEVGLGISEALYSARLWPALGAALAQAIAGDGSGMVQLADEYLRRDADGSYPNLQEVYVAVSCLDYSWPSNPEAFRALAASQAQDAPHFGSANLLESALPCATWPAPPQPLGAPTALGAPPILVIATTNDPATPFADGAALSNQLESGTLLIHVGEGHTVYGSGNACVTPIVNAYLLDLAVIASGTTCTDTSSTPVFPPDRSALPFGNVLPGIARAP
ncbi:MAG: alpha/beta fold hydrolase [Chloroflexi bacterium]|nr:alpha/beta fold hydrolase [Chloroflexota bacterium]